MSTSSLYDLSPAFWLMLVALLLAALPLAWVGWRNRAASGNQRLRALTLATLFVTFDLVLFGAFTRLTDSGLGCPDWPGCYGASSPLGAVSSISAAQFAMPTGPVTHNKAWIEMTHRYLASGVGVMIMVLVASSWVLFFRQRSNASDRAEARSVRNRATAPACAVSPWWPTFTLLWVCLQGAFGALTVTMKLFPAIVTLHLLGGLVLLALLSVQAARYRLAEHDAQPAVQPVMLSSSLRGLLLATFALLWLQVALGGWVSTNYAVLACTQFPMCQGSWWPNMAFAEGFQLWRALGVLHDGSYISFAGLTAIHYVHRLSAYVVFAALGWLAWRLFRVPALQRQARWIAGLALWQLATGLSNVVLGWPLVAAVSHTGGAAALVAVLAWTVASSRTKASA